MKRLILIALMFPLLLFGQSKIRNTQITSGSQPEGKVMVSDGATNVVWGTKLDSITGTLPIVTSKTSSDVFNVSINPATTTTPGSMSAADKLKLDSLHSVPGSIDVATLIETLTGIDDTKAITPLKLLEYIKVNALTYNDANQNVNLGTYNLIGDTINATGKLQINGVNVRNDWVTDAIVDGVTTVGPSQNAVFDALSLKLPVNNPTATGLLTTPNLKVSSFTNADYVLKTNADGTIYTAALAASQVYKGTWNATTNTPTLVNGTGTSGWYYRVTVAGTVNFGAGNITFSVGDDVSYNGSIWERIPAAAIMGNPLTKTDDTNITLTLGGSPATALVNAASITAGWTGTLADSRITSSGNWNSAYNDKVNSLAVTGTTTKTITLTQQDGGTVAGNFTDNVDDADNNPTNEIQDLSGAGATLSGYVISLSSDGTPVTLPNEADGDPTNEIQDLSLTGNTLSLSLSGATVDLSGYANVAETDPIFAADSAYIKSHIRDDNDLSNVNEIQGLNYSAATRTLDLSLTTDDVVLPLADGTNAGLMSNTHYTKLEGIAAGAEVNVNADWNAVSGDALILNKPTIPTLGSLGGQPLLAYSETIVSTAGVVTYVLPFTLKSTTFVWFNGALLKQTNWSGVGTTTLTLLVNTEIYDTIKIQN